MNTNTKPKWATVFTALSPALFFSFFLFLAVNNYKKDPSDNFSLASIIFFSLLIGYVLGSTVTKFLNQKSDKQLN